MVWGNILIIAVWARLAESMDWHYFPPRVSPVWGYLMPPVVHRTSFPPEPDPMDLMVDMTNSLGVAVLQDCAHTRSNFAFSPYGMASVLVVLYEGACGESAKQIQRTVGFPADKDIIRMGFRDIHRHLRSYFSHEGFLSGITLNKEASTLKPSYKKILKFYGYDVDISKDDDKKTNEGNVTRTTISPDSTLKTTVVHTKEQTKGTTDHSTPTNTNFPVEPTRTEPYVESSTTVDTISTTQSEAGQTSEMDAFIKENTTKEPTILDSLETTVPGKVEPSTKEVPSSTWAEKTKGDETTSIPTTIGNDDDPNEITTNALRDTEIEIQSATVFSTVTILPESTTRETMMATQEPTSAKKKIEVGSTLDNGMLIPQSVDLETTTISFSSEVTNSNIKDYSEAPIRLEVKSQTVTLASESFINEVTTQSTSLSNDEGTTPLKSLSLSNDLSMKSDMTTISVLSLIIESPNTTPIEVDFSDIPVTEKESTLWTTPVPETKSVNPSTTTKVQTVDDVSTSPEETSETSPKFSNESSTFEANEMSSVSTEIESVTTTASPGTEVTEPITSEGDVQITTFSTTFKNDETTDLDVTTTEKSDSYSNKVKREILENSTSRLRTSSKTFVGIDFPTTRKLPKKISDHNNRTKRTIIDYLKSPFQPDLSLQLQNGMYETYVLKNLNTYNYLPRYLFLVDGIMDTPVPMMTYTNVFQFGFIPRLHSRALIFPLDDVRYKLLILLPLERRGLGQLLHDLGSCSLREVIESIHPTKVRVTIPIFTVEGFVILTSTLQKLGIWDVFDPRRANLSGMSADPDLYVRNIEQSVTVVIRNYVDILDIQTRTIAARQVIHDFEVSHPFVYFVLDSATNVALMAGQMLDPLSSRIY